MTSTQPGSEYDPDSKNGIDEIEYPYPCDDCERGFLTPGAHNAHQRVHGDDEIIEVTDGGEAVCPVCGDPIPEEDRRKLNLGTPEYCSLDCRLEDSYGISEDDVVVHDSNDVDVEELRKQVESSSDSEIDANAVLEELDEVRPS